VWRHGREERCEGACSEHKLLLVSAVDYDALLGAAHAARVRAARLASAVGPFADAQAGSEAFERLRDGARAALRDAGSDEPDTDRASPATVTGWWRAVWQRGHAATVHRGLRLASGGLGQPRPLRASAQARRAQPAYRAALSGFLTRISAVTPRAGAWQRNWDAFRAQPRVALEDFVPGSPAPAPSPAGASRDDPGPVIGIHLWPR